MQFAARKHRLGLLNVFLVFVNSSFNIKTKDGFFLQPLICHHICQKKNPPGNRPGGQISEHSIFYSTYSLA